MKENDIVEIQGKKYLVKKEKGCTKCAFYNDECFDIERPRCADWTKKETFIFELIK